MQFFVLLEHAILYSMQTESEKQNPPHNCAEIEDRINHLERALQATIACILILNIDFTVRFVNLAWANMHGLKVDQIIGRPIVPTLMTKSQFEKSRSFLFDRLEKDFEQGYVGEMVFVRKDGGHLFIWGRATIAHNTQGVPDGYIVTGHDITDRKEMEQELISKTRALDEAQKVARIGSWGWDIERNVVHWSDEMYQIYELEPDSIDVSMEAWIHYFHPDTRQKMFELVEHSLQTKEGFNSFERMVTAQRRNCIIHCITQVEADENGKPIRLYGIVHDVTDAQFTEETLRRQTEELEKMNSLMIGRELKMRALKEKIRQLEAVTPSTRPVDELSVV